MENSLLSPVNDASKAVAKTLIEFCEQLHIPLSAFTRHTKISSGDIRQAWAGVRSLSPHQEMLIGITIGRIESGKLWLRRLNSQRSELESVDPPYKLRCPVGSFNCSGGLLPGSCYRRWKECPMNDSDWETVRKAHE